MSKRKNKGPRKTQKVRRKIYDKHNGICYLCNIHVPFEEMTLDHVIPKALGGSNKQKNLKPTHRKCNEDKSDKLI